MPIPEKVSLNKLYAGVHWSARKKLADLYHQSFLPFRTLRITEYPVDISYIFTFKGRPLDTTNVFAMIKMLEDGMVKHKILNGDSPEFVQMVTAVSKKGLKDEVEILIV